jgi:branched-subunit amino acid aminotransferase/4-amino-4-deoxychorismate lyase
MKRYRLEEAPALLERLRRPYQKSYLAMYSSLIDGIVTDPVLMAVPIDDHMVHRGDGVFETLKCVEGAIYNAGAHLERLGRSAEGISLRLPVSPAALSEIMVETARAGGECNCLLRVYVSRGPGSFGVSPYETEGPQLYVVATRSGVPLMQRHPEGVTLRTSSIPAKPAFFAGIKNCNYLPNVLMQKESVDLGVDFVVAYDDRGFMAEGPTENTGIVTRDGELAFPTLAGILKGTTMMRAAELARTLVNEGALRGVVFRDVSREEALAAAEILVVGTTRDVTAVREYDGKPVGDGRPGPVWRRLNELLQADIRGNAALRTVVFA